MVDDILICTGDLGDVPVALLWVVLKQCTAEQLASIEDSTAYVAAQGCCARQMPSASPPPTTGVVDAASAMRLGIYGNAYTTAPTVTNIYMLPMYHCLHAPHSTPCLMGVPCHRMQYKATGDGCTMHGSRKKNVKWLLHRQTHGSHCNKNVTSIARCVGGGVCFHTIDCVHMVHWHPHVLGPPRLCS